MDAVIEILLRGAQVFVTLAPIWVPVLLLVLFVKLWIDYVQLRTINSKDYILLEITLPEDITRSPLAMEVVFNVLHDRGTKQTWYTKWFRGITIPSWSLEIVSIEGNIHFYIWTEKQFQHLVEAQIYAQYPDAEIIEVQDYTQEVEYDEKIHSMWANEWEFVRPDVYPLKTYVDYGLDKDPKEEQKVDPITALLEFMGSLGPGEQLWTQFVIRMHDNKQKRKKGTLTKKIDTWVEEAKEEVEKIKKEATLIEEDSEGPPRLVLTPGQRDTIEAIERSVGKLPFDVGMRTIYIANQDKFRSANIAGLVGAMRQYNSYDLNALRPHYSTDFTNPWEDIGDRRTAYRKRLHFDAYRRRSFFYPPYRRKFLVLNTEELATIYHFPGRVATTPTFKRLESRKSEPPSNLPV